MTVDVTAGRVTVAVIVGGTTVETEVAVIVEVTGEVLKSAMFQKTYRLCFTRRLYAIGQQSVLSLKLLATAASRIDFSPGMRCLNQREIDSLLKCQRFL